MPDYLIDPDLREIADAAAQAGPVDIVQHRAQLRAMLGTGPLRLRPDVLAATTLVTGLPTPPPWNVRVYRPVGSSEVLPSIVQIHGGAFATGDLDLSEPEARRLCHDVQCVVVSVTYRLAPEHQFPAAHDDCWSALCWLAAHAEAVGVDASRIAVHGASAGAALAASLALRARDEGGPAIAFQSLLIPVLDDRMSTVSARDFVDAPTFASPRAELMWQHYLGLDPGEVSAYAAPARATDLSGLPPAYIDVTQYDPLRDEGLEFACRLLAAGISVELHLFPGTFHASLMAAGADVNRTTAQLRTRALRRALHP